KSSSARIVLAGALILLVVHTLGRFIYTPLLPWLIDDGVLTITQGADVASWNYLGYLLGAMLAIRWSQLQQIQRILPKALIVNVLCTLAQTQTEDRKSTRLNSSHVSISYAVFCL